MHPTPMQVNLGHHPQRAAAAPSFESVNPLHAAADAAQLDTTSDGIELGHLNRPSLYEIVQANRNARNSADVSLVSADVGEPPQPGGSGAGRRAGAGRAART